MAEAPPAAPPPPPAHQNYGDAAYWDERYRREPVCFDWYQGYSGLAPLLAKHMKPHEPVLHVGMGTSTLQEGMVRQGGFTRVVNVDVSKVVVDMMAKLHSGIEGLEYRQGDIRSLPEFPDGTFGGIIDKGTIDAILCGQQPATNTAAALSECCRLLMPGGCLLLVTYGDPESRLNHLITPHLAWSIQVYVVSKPSMDGVAGEGAGAGGQPQRTAIQGPYDARRQDAMDAIGSMRDVHFVYVCTRHEPGVGGSKCASSGASAAPAAGAPEAEAEEAGVVEEKSDAGQENSSAGAG